MSFPAFLVLALAAASPAVGAAQPAPATPPPNLLLVTIDTLRADRVGAYGYAKGTTPTLDRLAREGLLVEEAVVQVPQTRPSHVSIFTGLQPYEHGVRDNLSPPLEARFPTLATLLKGRGYATGGFIGAYPVSRDSGLDRGFDRFDDPFGRGSGRARDDRSARPAREVVDPALAWLRGLGKRPFFAWVHLFDPHAPYTPPSPYRERFKASPYDGEVAYADAQLARLLEWLGRSGEAARTLVVVTSDHGEGLGDHGWPGHQLLYQEQIHVPLLVRLPGGPRGKAVSGVVRTIDIFPTVLDSLGVAPPGRMREHSLRRLIAGEAEPPRIAYAEQLNEFDLNADVLRGRPLDGRLYCITDGAWKLILRRNLPDRSEMFRTADDPGELRNRYGDAREEATRLLAILDAMQPYRDQPFGDGEGDREALERLRSLGYVGRPAQ